MSVYQFEREQLVPASIEKVWDFMSSPVNLKRITPDYMGFDITSEELSEKMFPGMIICYRVSPLLGIKTTWVTEITHVVPNSYFVDEQRVGPYSLWHHMHEFKEHENGVLMRDVVHYVPPFGFLGDIAQRLIIKKKLEEIFNYRTEELKKIFPH